MPVWHLLGCASIIMRASNLPQYSITCYADAQTSIHTSQSHPHPTPYTQGTVHTRTSPCNSEALTAGIYVLTYTARKDFHTYIVAGEVLLLGLRRLELQNFLLATLESRDSILFTNGVVFRHKISSVFRYTRQCTTVPGGSQ